MFTLQEIKDYVRAQMVLREGMRLQVYEDSEGFPTVGIGHKVTEEDNLRLGDIITPERVEELYDRDITWAIKAALKQAEITGVMTLEWISALTSVNFQLGPDWTTEFFSTWPALVEGDYERAIANLLRSKWMQQTPVRVHDFINAIYQLKEKPMEKEDIKSGVQTSEFWLTVVAGIITLIVSILNQFLDLGLNAEDILTALSPVLAYILGRSAVKTADAVKKKKTETV